MQDQRSPGIGGTEPLNGTEEADLAVNCGRAAKLRWGDVPHCARSTYFICTFFELGRSPTDHQKHASEFRQEDALHVRIERERVLACH
jgi:hypothetical protein